MATVAAERGGPFGRKEHEARNWMRASAPGIAFRCRPAESSPLGSASSPRRTRQKGRKRAVWIVCIALAACVGAACLGDGLYIYAKARVAQVLLHSAWSQTQATGNAVKPWPWADTHPVARLTAPSLEADFLVLAGASGRTLAFGPGHLDGSAAPGDAGNAVITGHRDTHFRFLERLVPGDPLAVERADGSQRHFAVRRTYVADFRTLAIPRDTRVPTLTLVTCYPFDAINPGGPLRYVVVAEAI